MPRVRQLNLVFHRRVASVQTMTRDLARKRKVGGGHRSSEKRGISAGDEILGNIDPASLSSPRGETKSAKGGAQGESGNPSTSQ